MTVDRSRRAALMGMGRGIAAFSAGAIGALGPAVARAQGKSIIQIENEKPGSWFDWTLFTSDPNFANTRNLQIEDFEKDTFQYLSIEGYASATSVARGGTIKLFISSSSSNYTIFVHRLGWYGGAGSRLMATIPKTNGTKQPPPYRDTSPSSGNLNFGLVECDWTVSHVLQIGASNALPESLDYWASGCYVARVVAADGFMHLIPFIVRDSSQAASILVSLNSTTAQAYNRWGGYSLYWTPSITTDDDPDEPCQDAVVVSFNRPYDFFGGLSKHYFNHNYYAIRFFERDGFDVTYCDSLDLHADSGVFANRNLAVSIGHDEYWSSEMRQRITSALTAGARPLNLAFLGDNQIFWQVRFGAANAQNGGTTVNRRMYCYKDYDNAPACVDNTTQKARIADPIQGATKTTRWRHVTPAGSKSEAQILGNRYDDAAFSAKYPQDLVISGTAAGLYPWLYRSIPLTAQGVSNPLLGLHGDEPMPRCMPNDGGCPDTQGGQGVHVVAYGQRGPHSDPRPLPNGQLPFSPGDSVIYTAPNGSVVFSAGTKNLLWGLSNFSSWLGGPGTPVGNNYESTVAKQLVQNVLTRLSGSDACFRLPAICYLLD